MKTKEQLRRKFTILRKKRYFDVPSEKFKQLIIHIKKKYKFRKKFQLLYIIRPTMNLIFLKF